MTFATLILIILVLVAGGVISAFFGVDVLIRSLKPSKKVEANDTRGLTESAIANNLTIEANLQNLVGARRGDLSVMLSNETITIRPDTSFPSLEWETGIGEYPKPPFSNLVPLYMDKDTLSAFQSFPKAALTPDSLVVDWTQCGSELTRALNLARHFKKSLSEVLGPALARAKSLDERLVLLNAAIKGVKDGDVDTDDPQLAVCLRPYLQGDPKLAARAAALIGDEGIQLLISWLKGDVHYYAYFDHALDALTAMGPRAAVPHLDDLLTHEKNVRRALKFILALGQLNARASVPVIAEAALRLDHEETTEAALETMAGLDQYNPAALPFLDHVLETRSPFYRQAAQHARAMNRKEARSLLQRELMLPGLSIAHKKMLLELLAAAPQTSDTKAVQTAASQGNHPELTELAIRYFRIDDTGVLVKALALDDRALQEKAVKRLARVGDVNAVAPLCRIRDHSRGSLKKAAAEAVALIQGRLGNVEGGWLTLARPSPLEGSLSLEGNHALEGGLSPEK
ncbi:MAG: HEAT repeat domain-containing protein [Acidobacteriota bacterium]|nr:HEAT repeat domain-containing protein [Acidobacteriota bacterium]